MADNVAITPGTGATVAADDIAGVLHQRVKIGLGADGTAVDAVAGAGAVGAGVQRVTLASDDPAVASLAALRSTNTHRLLACAGSTNATSVKGAAGALHMVAGFVARADEAYLKIYNKATAPVVGTDIPVITIRLLRSAYFGPYDFKGAVFSLGIAYAITTAAADADTGAVNAADIVCMNLTYT